MEYNFSEIERNWKQYWNDNKVYKVENPAPGTATKPKYYILDMFPYPSGAGLHVGHPLGYIASDIYARYKKLCGYNVLHPMGFDAFGLPAEQYAMETGQHPAVTTEKNIARYREQLDNIGFCYDWDRAVRTSDADYYKWTQWIFLQLFHSWYDRTADKAKPLADLIAIFELEGNINVPCPGDETISFTHEQWGAYSEKEKRAVLMNYRIAYQGYAQVWWCEALGTVLANDEVVNGVSERGGHPVERKNMRQWFLRITEFAERLLNSLDTLDWTDAMKEMQRNWIGRSNGAEVKFDLGEGLTLMVFTTRPDTIFGVDFMVMAPEHELVDTITTVEQDDAVQEYKKYVKSRSERERMSEVKQITGCFTGAYVTHPLTGKKLPVWISEYVLAGYGTGAIMAVPSGDDRDHAFAKHFNIPITNVFGDSYTDDKAYSSKTGTIENSDFLSGMQVKDAIDAAINALVKAGVGKKKVNFRLRDAGFSRQRYWGEPFPIVYINDVPYGTDETEVNRENNFGTLPVELPMVEHYRPGPEGQGPLANIPEWMNIDLSGNQATRETNTMPGYAGSSWYFLRYMDPHNGTDFAGRSATDYWQQVDLYIGGTEHAVGHLLYSRMWTKVLYDLGYIGFDEPFKKLLNQGMITGVSEFIKELRIDKDIISQFNNCERQVCFNVNNKEIKINIQFGEGHNHIYISQDVNFSFNLKVFEFSSQKLIEVKSDISEHRANIQFIDQTPEKSTLDIEKWMIYQPVYKNSLLICNNGYWFNNAYHDFDGNVLLDKLDFRTLPVNEKMSKSKLNTHNPDDLVERYGADTFRMYEMFLGPVEQSKPWDTKGIEGVHRFLRKLWRLFFDELKGKVWNEEQANAAELKIIHRAIKKIEEDTERFSFNTAVSAFMVCVNELADAKCNKKEVLKQMLILLVPYAPHIAEELWHELGNAGSILDATYPTFNPQYLVETTKEYPVSINGKMRTTMNVALDASAEDVEQLTLANEVVQKWLEGKAPKKFIFVKGKMINLVI